MSTAGSKTKNSTSTFVEDKEFTNVRLAGLLHTHTHCPVDTCGRMSER